MDKYIAIGPLLSPITFQQYLNAGEAIHLDEHLYFSRLVEAIGERQTLQVLTIPPKRKTKKTRFLKEQLHHHGNVLYVEFAHVNFPYVRSFLFLFHMRRYIRKLLKKSTSSLTILVDLHDSLSRKIIRPFHHHPRVKTIGVFQDVYTPSTPKASRTYQRWIKNVRSFSGWIGNDHDVLKQMEQKSEKTFYLPGIVDEPKGAKKHPRAYFFYSGTLDIKHGIDLLMRGFLDLELTNMDLLIAGTGTDVSLVEQIAKQHRHVKYLGVIHPIIAQKYQAGAYANINPQPSKKEAMFQTIPSKILDYLSSGAPTLSSRQPWLEKHFPDQIFWIDTASIDGLRVALDRFLKTDYTLAQTKAIKAKQFAMTMLNASKVGQDLLTWMMELK
jgi:glycosyltransferase involved in cell wall biosynthesis